MPSPLPYLFTRDGDVSHAIFAPSLQSARDHVRLSAASDESYRSLRYEGRGPPPERAVKVGPEALRKAQRSPCCPETVATRELSLAIREFERALARAKKARAESSREPTPSRRRHRFKTELFCDQARGRIVEKMASLLQEFGLPETTAPLCALLQKLLPEFDGRHVEEGDDFQ